jgi:DNA-binding NarL/FixJ family response regulator
MSVEQAIAYAQTTYPPATSDAPASAAPGATGPLTRRELQVTTLIAQGLSNRQIANSLVITERTVAAHVEHILNKLAFASRTQVGVWAASREPVESPRYDA